MNDENKNEPHEKAVDADLAREMEGVPEEVAREALTLAAAKLPFKTVFVKRTAM